MKNTYYIKTTSIGTVRILKKELFIKGIGHYILPAIFKYISGGNLTVISPFPLSGSTADIAEKWQC